MYIHSMTSKYLQKRQNPANKLITAEALEKIMSDNGLGIKVNDITVYQQAFIHRSYLKTANRERPDPKCVPLQETCNETYEFLGDTILSSVIGTYLYDRYYTQENEGFMTKTRTKMVRGTTLGQLAKQLGFGEWIVISQHVEDEDGRNNIRILEDLFEAFIAAIYLDNGSEGISTQWFSQQDKYITLKKELEDMEKNLNSDDIVRYVTLNQNFRNLINNLFTSRTNGYLFAQLFIRNTYERYIDIVKLIQYDDNYKDQLQTFFQKKYDMFPKWNVLKEQGKTNQRWYQVGVRDRCGYLVGTGEAPKKTEAEQLASRNALIHYGVIPENHGANFFKQ